MNINYTEFIIGICSLVITFVLVPLIQKLKKEANEKLTKEQLYTIEYWTECGVRWAKQWLQSESGEKKKEEVMNFICSKMAELKIDISAEDLDKIIESVYEQVKKEV